MNRTGSHRGFVTSIGVAASVVPMVAVGVGLAVFTRPLLLSSTEIHPTGDLHRTTVENTAAQPEEARPDAPGRGGQPDLGQQLIEGLKATPGCLGVDAAQMMSGKNSIFAWFKNKEAVEEWYYSRVHREIMKTLVDDDARADDEPLSFIEDEEIPILVIASITFTDKPSFESIKLPISQISIEMFAPLPGGAYLGGRLAPKEFKVPHMKQLGGK